MNISEACLNSYLVRHLQPLTEADPTILAKYVAALLKNNKPKKELHALCIEHLLDFLGEYSRPFVDDLFDALDNGSISIIQSEPGPKTVNYATLLPSTRRTPIFSSLINSSGNIEKQIGTESRKMRLVSYKEDDASVDKNNDWNHKHKGNVNKARFPENHSEVLCVKKRPRLTFPESSSSNHICLQKEMVYRQPLMPVHAYGSLPNFDNEGGQCGIPRGSCFLTDNRLEGPSGLTRDVASGGRTIGSKSTSDPTHSHTVETHFNMMSLPAAFRPSYALGNRVQSFGPGYNIQSSFQNAELQGSRGATSTSGSGIGPRFGRGLPRCPDYEELGYCLRGDLCPMYHGANRIVVEDVQSLSNFNLPVAVIGNHGVGLPANKSSSVEFSTAHKSGTSILNLNKPDIYDPDEPLWVKRRSVSVVDVLKNFPSSKNGLSLTRCSSIMKPGSVWNHAGRNNDSGNPNILADVAEHANGETDKPTNIKQRAQQTLLVSCIPPDKKEKNALMAHFQRFGKVVDARIPHSGDFAFVQFSRREEAISALSSSDAVMGNRFIRLSWAQRDNMQKRHSDSIRPKSMSSVSCFLKPIDSTTLPVTLDGPQRKQEEIKRMKEEIRRKYEALAKKHDQFQLKLDGISKQTRFNSYEDATLLKMQLQEIEQRLYESGKELCHVSNGSTTKLCQGAVKLGTSGLPSFQKICSKRYKIDNRTAVFRIIPPFPDSLLDISALKNHFSLFGEILSVENENIDLNSECTSPEKDGIRVSFATRRAAERAFFQGRCYKGISLQFAWYTSRKILPSNGNPVSGNHDAQASCTPECGESLEVRNDVESVQPHVNHVEEDGHPQIESDHSPSAFDVEPGPIISKVTVM